MSMNTYLRKCSCGKWQENGFLCSHTVVVLSYSSNHTGHDLFEYIEPYFSKRFYEQSVAEVIHLVVTFNKSVNDMSHIAILPPITRKMIGRPKKRKISSWVRNCDWLLLGINTRSQCIAEGTSAI